MPNDLPDISVPITPAPSTLQGQGFTAADLTWPTPPPTPAPEKYVPTAQELATAQPVTYKPTPEELATAKEVPQKIYPVQDFSVDQLVNEAKANPKEFDPVTLYMQAPPEVQHAPGVFEKVADAYNQLRQAGNYTPSLVDMLKNAGKGVVDLFKTGAKLVKIGTASPFTDLSGETPDTSTFRGQLTRQTQQEAGEFLAGQKVAALGFGSMLTKAGNIAARGLHLQKQLSDYTPEDKGAALIDEMATRHGMAREVKQGIAPQISEDMAKAGFPLRPEEVETSASGSPYAWEGAGMAFGGATRLVTDAIAPGIATMMAGGEATPEMIAAVQASLDRLPQASGNALATGIGKTVTAAGKIGAKTAEKVEPILEPAGKVVGATAGAFTGHHMVGLPGVALGIAEGFKRGGELGESAAQWAGKAATKFDNLADMGRQIATGEGVKSSTAQFVRDVAQATPGAALHAGAGVGMDAGLMAATTETPEERSNFTPFGTIFGTLSGAKRVGGWALSGNVIAPRDWGTPGMPTRPENFAANFPALDAEHNTSISQATPGVQQRVAAVQKFLDGAAPGTQVVYAPKPKAGQADALPAALEQAGIPAAYADQDGFTTTTTGPDGQPHRLIVVREIASAPHEARHAMDDVLGSQGVQALNDTAKQQFGDKWDAFKRQYAQRLDPTSTDPNRTILDMTGHGDAAAKDKIVAGVKDALVQEGVDPTDAEVREAAASHIQQLQGDAAQAKQPLWEHVLTPEEQQRVVDDYIGGEIRAENHDAWFKAGQPGTLRGKMGMAAANILSALGVNPLEGRATDYGTPVEGSLVNQARKTAPAAPAPKEERPAAPGSPAEQQQSVQNAQKAVQNAPDRTEPGALKSQKEILGVIAEAIARKQGVKITGLFAPEEPAASLTSDRPTRRAMIETFRSMPDAAKKLWEKNFFPENVPVTGRGNLQIFGWSPEVFAANAHKTAAALNDLADKGSNISPYELDPVTRSFTEQGWKDLYNDTQKFVQNHMAGRTGAGNPLVVPESVRKAGAVAPPVRGETAPIAQNKADFINHLFNARLPETGIARQGQINIPLNVAGQEISTATQPGRVQAPVRERGVYRGAVAARQGVLGRHIQEVNPFRNQLESALQQHGIENPSLIEVNQRLNLKNIKDVALAPEQPQFRGNTLTLQAGFQPSRTKAEAFARDNGFEDMDGKPLEINPDGTTTLYHWTTPEAADQIRKTGIWKSKENTDESFFSTNPESNYGQGFGTERLKVNIPVNKLRINDAMHGEMHFAVKNGDLKKIGANGANGASANFQPPKSVDELLEFLDNTSPDDFARQVKAYQGKYGGGQTGLSFDVGSQAKTPEEVGALRTAAGKFHTLSAGALREKDFNSAIDFASKSQAAREAYEAATGEGGAQDFIQRYHDPAFQSPMAKEAASFQPSKQGKLFDSANEERRPKIGGGKRWEDMTDSEQEAASENADKYFAIGHGGEEGIGNPQDRVWIAGVKGENFREAPGNQTHGMAFSHEVADRGFKGRYDAEKNQISVAFPQKLRDRLDHEPTVDDIPNGVFKTLQNRFGKTAKMVSFQPARFMHSLEGIKKMNDEEVARQERGRAETETTRASSYAGNDDSGIVLHSAKQRSTTFLRPGETSKEFLKSWKAAKTQEDKNHLLPSRAKVVFGFHSAVEKNFQGMGADDGRASRGHVPEQ